MFKVVNLREYKEVIERYSEFSITFIRVTDTEATLYIVKWNNYFKAIRPQKEVETMASIGKYSGEALATKEKIMAIISSYTTNTVYKNQEHNIYWFINNNGYMHILRPCNVRLDGKHLYFAIEDYLLTKDNMLQSKGHNGRYETIEAVIEELENRIGQ